MNKHCNLHAGKHRHNTKTEAVGHAKKAGKERGHDCHAYRCPGCKKWFVGGSKLSKAERLWKAIDEANGA